MAGKIMQKVFGSKNQRELKKMNKLVKEINQFEQSVAAFSEQQFKDKTSEFKQRVAGGESLENILPEAFAMVREAAKRTLGLRHFDVQLIGGITLHQGKIAEMRTGEGKTLVATLPVYLNALTGSAVHVVTVNDYLASRDAGWMEPVYNYLGLDVGVIKSGQMHQEKKQAYAADVVYGTNNEFGFDYLRDNMALRLEDKLQGRLSFAIVDEVDSILIDEARTPLIISGAAKDSSELYKQINKLIPLLNPHSEESPGHFVVDEKMRQVELTEDGHQKIEELLIANGLLNENDSLYQAGNLNLLHHIHSALRAHQLFHRDVEYIVQDGSIVLIDEHTGRTMAGRRLSEGLHQAIEAKEGVNIQSESQTVASTTFQNYFRLYDKLAGMTGTADTEAYEFHQIYGLPVVVIPTNVVVKRNDLNDLIYLSQEEKYDAVVKDIREAIAIGAPVLVGTVTIESSEELSHRLEKEKIPHQVLNAKFHAKEAEIIAQAGRPGTVTIATNMAGRGTDIVLGGNWEVEVKALENPSDAQIEQIKVAWKQRHEKVIEAGGLHILGTERHESRRIDNQLRGRSGRQGDPGVSRFYLSLDDPLMRLFASPRVQSMMRSIGMEKGEAIEHRMVTNAIEKAQRKVEGRNFDIRKQLLEFDDVANDQRQVIYQQRNDLLEADDISDIIENIRHDVIEEAINGFIPPQSLEEQWDVPGLEAYLANEFGLHVTLQKMLDEDDRLNEDGLRAKIQQWATEAYELKKATVGEQMKSIEQQVMLQVLDNLWKEHLSSMDHLRQGIGLRAYAQKNPKQEYKRESFELFQSLLANIKFDTVQFLTRVQVKSADESEAIERQRLERRAEQELEFTHQDMSLIDEQPQAQTESKEAAGAKTFVREGKKVGRNDPCPCGSGKKYKQCHGSLN